MIRFVAFLPFGPTQSTTMPLRVAFNATSLLAPPTGIGNYIIRLGAALAASGEVDAYSFYGAHWRHEAPVRRAAESAISLRWPLREAIKPIVPFGRDLRQLQQRFAFARGLHKQAITIYHEPNYVPISYDVPVVVTVHDLSWRRYPEMHPRDRIRWLERAMPRVFERAAAILVDSDFIRREVLAIFGIDEARVHTAHLGVSMDFHPRSAMDTREALEARDLAYARYVLAVGTIEPRKNIAHLLAAYAQLPRVLRDRYPLVVAGAKGWRASDLEKELRALAADGRIRFLGHVPDDELPLLYAGAAAFVFPSLYEGFGLPPLEAMASGVAVLASDRASLPEVTGDAALMIDPERAEDTAAKLESLLDDAAARADLAQRGLERARGFTWDACARTTLGVYRAVSA